MRLGNVVDRDLPGFRRQIDICADAIRRNWRGRSAYIYRNAGGNGNVVINFGFIRRGLLTGEGVSEKLYALLIVAAALINFNLGGVNCVWTSNWCPAPECRVMEPPPLTMLTVPPGAISMRASLRESAAWADSADAEK